MEKNIYGAIWCWAQSSVPHLLALTLFARACLLPDISPTSNINQTKLKWIFRLEFQAVLNTCRRNKPHKPHSVMSLVNASELSVIVLNVYLVYFGLMWPKLMGLKCSGKKKKAVITLFWLHLNKRCSFGLLHVSEGLSVWTQDSYKSHTVWCWWFPQTVITETEVSKMIYQCFGTERFQQNEGSETIILFWPVLWHVRCDACVSLHLSFSLCLCGSRCFSFWHSLCVILLIWVQT